MPDALINIAEGLFIAKNDVANTTFIHKFGAAPDFDVGDGFDIVLVEEA